ncbi:MAG: hypothetical protein ACYS7Y_30660 [Planctomycetota bacterium]|jgi:hypothetical protein
MKEDLRRNWNDLSFDEKCIKQEIYHRWRDSLKMDPELKALYLDKNMRKARKNRRLVKEKNAALSFIMEKRNIT